MAHHNARFTWGAGAQTVCVAGNFNNWAADASPLHKQPDGSFAADIPVPWGGKQAFKYVVDGEWKVREDEAKEWDAAGNMNNVYTAPPAPISTSEHSSAPAPAPATSSPTSPKRAAAIATSKKTPTPAPAPSSQTAHPTEADKPSAAAPSTSEASTAAPTETTTKPATLIASSAPAAALGAPILGGPVFPTSSSKSKSTSSPVATTTTTVIEPSTTTTSTTSPVFPTPHAEAAAHPGQQPLAEQPIPVQIEKVAAKANIGEATTGPEEQGLVDRASDFASGALAAIGAVVGNAAVAVEKVTGVDLAHADPAADAESTELDRAECADDHQSIDKAATETDKTTIPSTQLSVQEAKAQGFDINALEKRDAETDTTAPIGTAPPASAVSALEEKVQELKVGSSASAPASKDIGSSRDTTGVAAVPLPKVPAPKTSLPPPGTVRLNEKPDEPKPEHDIPAQTETTQNHQIVPQPSITTVSDKDPKKDRTLNATSDLDTAGTKPISHDPAVSAKDEKKKAESDSIGAKAGTDSPLKTQRVDPNAASSNVKSEQSSSAAPPAASASATPSAAAAANSPITPAKTPVAPSTPAKTAATTTPASTNGVTATPVRATATVPTPASAVSTPASTPAKSTHGREQTTDSDIRKRKSSIFTKIKHAFSPKDKEKSAK